MVEPCRERFTSPDPIPVRQLPSDPDHFTRQFSDRVSVTGFTTSDPSDPVPSGCVHTSVSFRVGGQSSHVSSRSGVQRVQIVGRMAVAAGQSRCRAGQGVWLSRELADSMDMFEMMMIVSVIGRRLLLRRQGAKIKPVCGCAGVRRMCRGGDLRAGGGWGGRVRCLNTSSATPEWLSLCLPLSLSCIDNFNGCFRHFHITVIPTVVTCCSSA